MVYVGQSLREDEVGVDEWVDKTSKTYVCFFNIVAVMTKVLEACCWSCPMGRIQG